MPLVGRDLTLKGNLVRLIGHDIKKGHAQERNMCKHTNISEYLKFHWLFHGVRT